MNSNTDTNTNLDVNNIDYNVNVSTNNINGSGNFLTNKKLRKILKKLFRLDSKKGYGLLLFLVFCFFMVGVSLLLEPIATSSIALEHTQQEIALDMNEHINIAFSSPIRHQIIDQMYKNIQDLLISHINAAAGSAPYTCNGQTVQPTSVDPVGGSLENQFGLCFPETALYGLQGDTNKSIDFLSTAYPNYKTPIPDKDVDNVRQMMIRKYQNDYSYTLRPTYVGKEVLSQGASGSIPASRLELYHWVVRADIESHTYREITGGMVIYYDVYLTNGYYPGNFYGGGSACDEKASYTSPCGTDELGNAINCAPVMVQQPDGSWGFAVQYGQDDPNYKPVDTCGYDTVGGQRLYECPVSGNRVTIEFPSHGVRQQTGCASASTGLSGVTAPDNGGYGFSLAVRIVSIGNPYN